MLRFNPAILVVCLLPLALAGCRDNSPKDDPRTQPPLVRVTKVISATDGSRAFSGVVVARVQSDLGFRVSGKILERLVDSGQRVKRGQPLMRLDPADLRLQAQAQQQAVAAAQARVRQASADQARYRTLVATGAVSASAY
ncbi:biotin/lipoyl-binding protein, partial [Pantoea agglomerans]|nr:biotin/lipoyl-binding protein [Pantoea agglomerans]